VLLVYGSLTGRRLVVSYPKAGRTWLRVMLDALGVHAEYTHFGAGVKDAQLIEEIRGNPLWCHGRTTLLLVRDPRDTLVSSFFQATKRRHVYAGDITAFVRDPRFGIEKLARWNLMWAELPLHQQRFGLVTYEALRSDPRAMLRGVVHFFGADRSDAAIDGAVEGADIDVMRAKEVSGAYTEKYGKALKPGDVADRDSYKVRRGVVGGYRESLSEGDVAYCDETLARLDYWARLRVAGERFAVQPALQRDPAHAGTSAP
jgi:hypothetical protein